MLLRACQTADVERRVRDREQDRSFLRGKTVQ